MCLCVRELAYLSVSEREWLFECVFVSQSMHVCFMSSSCLLIHRLWYENPGVFTSAQRAALSCASLARIMCDNTGILQVTSNPFKIPNRGTNRIIDCNRIPQFNLQAWIVRPTKTKQQDQNQEQEQEPEQSDQDNKVIGSKSVNNPSTPLSKNHPLFLYSFLDPLM